MCVSMYEGPKCFEGFREVPWSFAHIRTFKSFSYRYGATLWSPHTEVVCTLIYTHSGLFLTDVAGYFVKRHWGGFTKPPYGWGFVKHLSPLRDFVYTYMNTYAHFSLFFYRYCTVLCEAPSEKELWVSVGSLYIHRHIFIFISTNVEECFMKPTWGFLRNNTHTATFQSLFYRYMSLHEAPIQDALWRPHTEDDLWSP